MRGKIITGLKILIFAELCLQAVSLTKYAYGRFQSYRQQKEDYVRVWVNHDARFHWWFEESPLITLAYSPFVNWKTSDIHTSHITVQQSIRNTTGNPVSSDASVKQIYTFGGSAMWGFYVKDDETIPSFLATAMNKDGAWRVTNYADNGYEISQDLAKLTILLKQGHIPDVAVFYDGCNDLRANTPYGRQRKSDFENAITKQLGDINQYPDKPSGNRSIFSVNALRQAGDFIYTYVKIVRYPIESIRFLIRPAGPGTLTGGSDPRALSDAAKIMAQNYMENARVIESLSKTFGFRYILIWQPIIIDKNPLTADEKELVKMYQLSQETEPVWLQAKRNLLESHIPNFYDLSDLFSSSDKTVFIDRCHITPEGNRLVAEQIQTIIQAISN